MARLYEVVTFDCYGTLIDWNTGLADALIDAAREGLGPMDRAALLAAYHEFEPLVEADAHRSYREVLSETATRAAASLGCNLSPAAARRIPQTLPGWPPFADTNPALERLHAAGYRLGIL